MDRGPLGGPLLGSMTWSSLLDPLLHLFWPCACPVCRRPGSPACPACLDSLIVPLEPRCLLCQGPSPCSRHPEAPWIRSGALHRGPAKDLVHGLKYGGWRALGRPLGASLGRRLPRTACLLVPVPLHRRSPRPYNQAAGLARGIASVWRVPWAERLTWRIDRSPQVRSGREERRLPPQALTWRGHEPTEPVVLVDDVCTTGETLRAAAEAVRLAGGSVAGAVTWTWSSGSTEGG